MDGETMAARKALIGAATSVVLLIIASLLSACGRGGAPSAIPTQNVSPGGYALTLLDGFGNTIPDDGRIALTVEESSGGIIAAAVLCEDGLPLGADLYAELSYPANVHPVKFSVGGAFGDEERSISLAVLNRQPLPVGVSLISPSRDETVPAGGLFTVEFARGGLSSPRAVSGAPTGDGNVLHDRDIAIVLDGLNVDFEWKERNCGDYDRDGVVGIADITPIAMHYGKNTGDDPDVVDLVDGSGNGEVDIADITPIAMNYADVIEGYRIWRSDLMGGQYLPEPGNPLSDVSASRPDEGAAPPGRLVYTFSDIAPDDTVYYIFYPYGDGETGVASDEIHPFTRDTVPPVWVSDVGIISAEMDGLTSISFSFGQAVDADSPPVKYRLYWQEGPGPMDFGSASVKVYEVGDGELTPYTRILSDGIVEEQMYSLCVRAFDDLGNETTNVNYLSAGGGSPDDTTPPEWASEVGIISAVPGDAQVTVTWGEATDAESEPVTYLLFVAEAAEGVDWETPYNTYSAGTLSTVVDSLDNGTEYEFGVRARDSSVNQNTTTNTDTLTATPVGGAESPYPFGNPPLGVIPGWNCTDSAIACDVEAQPVIVSADSKDVTGLNLHYYDDTGGEWLHFEIEASHEFYHPQIVLSGEQIYVAAFDGATGQLKLYVGNTTGDSWSSEVVASGYAEAFSVDLDIHETTDKIGIVASLNLVGETGANDELRYFTRPLSGGAWENELIDDSKQDCFGTFMYHPATGAPLVGLGRGELNFLSLVSNALLCWAERIGEDEWTVTQLPGERKIEAIDISVDPTTGVVFLALAQKVTVTVDTKKYDGYEAVVGAYGGEVWIFELAETATWYPEGGEVIHLEFEGADPQISFRADGKGKFTWVHIDMIGSEPADTLVHTNLEASTYDTSMHTWSTGLDVTSYSTGASADSMVYVIGGIQASYAKIPTLYLWTLPQSRNDYTEGELAYYRE